VAFVLTCVAGVTADPTLDAQNCLTGNSWFNSTKMDISDVTFTINNTIKFSSKTNISMSATVAYSTGANMSCSISVAIVGTWSMSDVSFDNGTNVTAGNITLVYTSCKNVSTGSCSQVSDICSTFVGTNMELFSLKPNCKELLLGDMAYVPTPNKKTNWLMWILIGAGAAFVALVVIVILVVACRRPSGYQTIA